MNAAIGVGRFFRLAHARERCAHDSKCDKQREKRRKSLVKHRFVFARFCWRSNTQMTLTATTAKKQKTAAFQGERRLQQRNKNLKCESIYWLQRRASFVAVFSFAQRAKRQSGREKQKRNEKRAAAAAFAAAAAVAAAAIRGAAVQVERSEANARARALIVKACYTPMRARAHVRPPPRSQTASIRASSPTAYRSIFLIFSLSCCSNGQDAKTRARFVD